MVLSYGTLIPVVAPVTSRRTYRGGFHTSICDIFRDPHRRTDCCAVACCGILSSDRSLYLLTGERPPPLWKRVLMYIVIPSLLLAAMNYFAEDVTIKDENGESETYKVPSAKLLWVFIVYIILLICLGFGKQQSTRREIMTKLYEERCRERGEEVNPHELKTFLQRHNTDTTRAQNCCSLCFRHDYDFIDEMGVINNGRIANDNNDCVPEDDFCTHLWDYLSGMFWCCGCWCQCFGICALAQEEREINRLTGNDESKIDYLTMQPYSEYYPAIVALRNNQNTSPWAHIRAISELSSKMLKNVAGVLILLLIFAVSEVDEAFTWENLIVLLMTLGQAFFIEYLVHWRWNLFDISFDSVVKYFASGFFLATPMAVIFESIVSSITGVVILVIMSLVIASDNQITKELSTNPKKGMEDFTVNHPEVFVLVQFVNAFCEAALVEELMKYFAYRMVVTPETITQSGQSSSSSLTRSSKSTGSAVTVAMVSTALGFACCENLVYIFIYSPPSLDNQISTLLARSFFPVHPLCAAIQSIGVCRRDLEGDKRYGLGRIIFPAFLLHGSFDFVLMLATYFQQVKNIKEENDDGTPASHDDEQSDDVSSQLPALTCGLGLVATGYTYYVFQSRAQTARLVALDNSAREIAFPDATLM